MNISRPPEHRWKSTHYTHTANPPSVRHPHFATIYFRPPDTFIPLGTCVDGPSIKGGKLEGLFTPSKDVGDTNPSKLSDSTPTAFSGPIIKAEEAYTPTTDYVRENFLPVASDLPSLSDVHSNGEYFRESAKAFDRWLVEHDRELQARAWREGHVTGMSDEWRFALAVPLEITHEITPNPYESEES